MTALESLDSPLVLILTRDSLKSIPSREALLALLKKYALELPMGLIRDIEQRQRLSQKLCDGYHEIFETNEISVFPAPLSTHQNDTRTLAPRHLAHLVSTAIPRLELAAPALDLVENPNHLEQESTDARPPEAPRLETVTSASSPHESDQVPDLARVSASILTVTMPATSASPWRRFLQAVGLSVLFIAFTIFAASLTHQQQTHKNRVLQRVAICEDPTPRVEFDPPVRDEWRRSRHDRQRPSASTARSRTRPAWSRRIHEALDRIGNAQAPLWNSLAPHKSAAQHGDFMTSRYDCPMIPSG